MSKIKYSDYLNLMVDYAVCERLRKSEYVTSVIV